MRTATAAAVLLLLAIVIYVPIALPPAETEPDLSLRSMAHFAFAHRLQSGSDIVYTYGPWAILQQRGFDPATNATVLAVSALLALCFAWALFRIVRDAGGRAAAIAAIAIAAAAVLAGGGDDARFIAIDLLLLFCLFIDEPSPSREWPLVAAAALLCLIKFSFLIISIFVVAIIALRRRSFVIPIVFVAAFVLADVAAFQNPLLIPLMLRRGWQVTSGYSEAASLAAGIGWTMPIAAAGVAALIVIVAFVERRWLPTIAIAGAAWLILKIGYVRQDDTHIRMCGALLPFLFLGYGLLRSRNRIRWVMGAGVAAMFLINAPTLIDAAIADVSWLGNRDARTAAAQRDVLIRSEGLRLPPQVRGSIDAYPWGGAALIARGFDYTPRPVFESYMAWTPELAELNAFRLRSPAAPQNLWVTAGTIDGRFPLLDDAPSWIAMMRRYAVAQFAGDHLLLRKREPHSIAQIAIASSDAHLGEAIAVPAREMIWCTIDLRPTLIERIEAIAARPPAVFLEVTSSDGSRVRYRAPVAMLRGGFLLSPDVRDVNDLAALLNGGAKSEGRGQKAEVSGGVSAFRLLPSHFAHRVTTIRVVAERGYASAFRIAFSELKSGS